MSMPIIYKGDDTNFNGLTRLALSVTTPATLAGCTLEFEFLGQTRQFSVTTGTTSLEFVFTAAETAGMPVGTHKARVRAKDASGRMRTLAEPRIKVTDNIAEAYSSLNSTQTIGVSLTSAQAVLSSTDVLDCSAGFTEFKRRVAYLWQACGGSVQNSDSLNY